MSASRLIACTAVGDARGADAVAAAVAVAAAGFAADGEGALVLDLRHAPRTPRGTLLASAPARALEQLAIERSGLRAAARGRVCFAAPALGEDGAQGRRRALDELLSPALPAPLVICVCESVEFRSVLAAAPDGSRGALLRTLPGADRSLLALLVAELRAERVPVRAWTVPLGLIGARRSLAGLEAGGGTGRRAARFAGSLAPSSPQLRRGLRTVFEPERAQALPAVLGVAVGIVALALILVAIGGAATAKGRLQRSADLAALSAARSMRDDFPRLFVPPRRPDGRVNPSHLERTAYLARAQSAGRMAAERNGIDADLVEVGFPDGRSMAPLRVRVEVEAAVEAGAGGPADDGATTEVAAEAEVSPPSSASAAGIGSSQPAVASGGGYGGPLAYRQGKGMRPDVAAAFDRMAAAAAASGVALVINSAFRSDAEQQRLWDQNPDPRWVAPPGTSLHRCATELDLGPPAAYGWLAANAGRFAFTQRYSWEAWHFGYDGGPAPCSTEGERVGAGPGAGGPGVKADGERGGDQGLPSFVPPQFRAPLLASAARHDVSAALLAAQLMAESNFNPNAVSPAGAQGIAQFMPATAAGYGLDDPFDPVASIDAQARMMGELMAQFGSVELALAAYNAGSGAVASCGCVPPYPETQAYVARIMGLLGGSGQLVAPSAALEVRLVG